MDLIQKIEKDFKNALKSKDKLKISVLRLLKSVLKNAEISQKIKGKELPEEKILEVIAHEVKKRKESIIAFEKGNRLDLAEKEKGELEILKSYLPEQLSDDIIRKVVKKKISEIGALGQSDFGKVMGNVMKELKGKAAGDRVSQIVKEELSK